jgi:hypothetical protein
LIDLRSGDVIRVWDHLTRPPKKKWHICVCPDQLLFFRINSRPYFPPHLLLRAEDTEFLDHDSYVELMQLIRLKDAHVVRGELLGQVDRTQKRDIVAAIERGGWMSEDWIEFIRDRFGL